MKCPYCQAEWGETPVPPPNWVDLEYIKALQKAYDDWHREPTAEDYRRAYQKIKDMPFAKRPT